MWNKQLKSNGRIAIALAVVVLVGFSGLGAAFSGSGSGDTAHVRVAHMSPDAPAVDVLVDGEAALEGVEFGAVSDYLQLSAGEHEVTIQTTEDETVVFEDTVSFEADTRYTVAAAGEVTEETFEPLIFEDDFETDEENASVRLIHVSPDAPAVDVTVEESGAVLYDNVSFGNATDYAEVPAGNYTLEVRPATEDDDGEVVATFDVSLDGDTAYSAFAAGYLNPDEAPTDEAFDLVVAVDSDSEAMNESMVRA
ncbi:DUF4397 domain-containing protein [Halorussus halophilus]|uniref:DUF4397 domain-containing protein n=1 Tax=Halorussus halophilus TaxID=2650975 RepID=UPI00178782E6|nr:DUF4397 domain-containing protein [Halorussus halophilus]